MSDCTCGTDCGYICEGLGASSSVNALSLPEDNRPTKLQHFRWCFLTATGTSLGFQIVKLALIPEVFHPASAIAGWLLAVILSPLLLKR